MHHIIYLMIHIHAEKEYRVHENKGYMRSIIRQFDKDPILYAGIDTFLSIYDASYSHMATEIPCEKIGKKIKARLNNRDRSDRETLNQEIIIAENGPSISEMGSFISEAVRRFLQKHRPPIISNTIYDTGSVVDRIMSETSKFNW